MPTQASQRRLVCPAPGTSGGARPTVVVAAPPGTELTATSSTAATTAAGEREEPVVATATSDASGRAVLEVQQPLPAGPVNLRVDGAGDPLWVQLVVAGSTAPGPASFAPPGLSLVYEDDFDAPLSLSETGRDSRYTAQRPTAKGGEGYGEAAFGEEALQADTAQTGDGLLHLRTEDAAGGAVGAMLSSATYGGAGFSAQYAYFETRALGAPGLGTWPAFWMLTTPALAEEGRDNAEVDAFEMYGHDTTGLCNSTHDYRGGQNADKQIDCNPMASGDDWAMQWHTYGARVLPDVVVFTTDGVETARIPRPEAGDEPFFFMLTLARGGGWPVDLSGTGDVADMYVDWVRVYT
ncbi:glycoside hydrolase family 16 protein [Streptomyces sp. NP160]|nr:glycoside hydrolase family 16 protein [Streptomyces sp. NP160]